MKRHSSIVLWISGWLLVLTVASLAEQSDPLEKVLQSMDAHAANFHTAQANFVWTPYNGVVKEEETPDKGKIYFRRSGKDIQMAAYLSPPDEKQIVFVDDRRSAPGFAAECGRSSQTPNRRRHLRQRVPG